MTPKNQAAVAEVDAVNPHTPKPGQGLVALAAETSHLEGLIMELAHANEGEVNAELDAYLDEIKTKLAEKPDQYKYVMDRLKMGSELLYAQAEQFLNAARATDNVIEQMKYRINTAMQLLGVDEIAGKLWRFKLQNTAKRLVVDEGLVNEHCTMVETLVGDILTHARAFRARSKSSDAGGAGAQLHALGASVDALDAILEAGLTSVVTQVGIDKAKLKAAAEAAESLQVPAPFAAKLEGGKALRSYVVKAGAK